MKTKNTKTTTQIIQAIHDLIAEAISYSAWQSVSTSLNMPSFSKHKISIFALNVSTLKTKVCHITLSANEPYAFLIEFISYDKVADLDTGYYPNTKGNYYPIKYMTLDDKVQLQKVLIALEDKTKTPLPDEIWDYL